MANVGDPSTPLKDNDSKYKQLYSEDDKSRHDEESEKPSKWRGIVVVFFIMLLSLLAGITFSVMAPFFPQMGKKKGLLVSQTGLVIGMYGLVVAIFSPIFGYYKLKIGTRFLFISSVLSGAVCFSLFGVLEYCPPGTVFFVMSLLVRIVQGICGAAIEVILLVKAVTILPSYASTVLGLFESANTVGEIMGPVIGGVLKKAGGFKMPFFVTGGAIFLIGLLASIGTAKYKDVESKVETVSVFSLLRSVKTCVFLFANTAAFVVLGGTTTTVSVYLRSEYKDTETMIGLTYAPPALAYILICPIWGYLGDKKPIKGRFMLIVGYLICGVLLALQGPAQFISPVRNLRWTFWVFLPIHGAFISTTVLNFAEVASVGRNLEKNEDDSTSMVVGLINGSNNLGLFLGAVVGGILMDHLGFRMTTTLLGMIMWLAALFVAALTIYEKASCKLESEDGEKFQLTDSSID